MSEVDRFEKAIGYGEYKRGLREGAVQELNWVLSKRVPKPLKALTTNNEEVILIYVKDVEKRLKELEAKVNG